MQSPIYLLSAVGAVCAAWFLWSLAIKAMLLDGMRERLFEIRFRLFELGMSGELAYDNEAYREIETLLCGLLRFGHRITLMTWVISRIEIEREKKHKDYVDVSAQITLKISRLQPSTQQKLFAILNDVHTILIGYAALSSLLFLSIYSVLKVLQLFGLWHPDREKEKVTRVIEREAYLAEKYRGLRLAPA